MLQQGGSNTPRFGALFIRRGAPQSQALSQPTNRKMSHWHGNNMATCDTVPLSSEQLRLATEARKCLDDNERDQKNVYPFSPVSEQLYLSLLRIVGEKLKERDPNIKSVKKNTILLRKGIPLIINGCHTTVAIQLPNNNTGVTVKVQPPRNETGETDSEALNWDYKHALFVPDGWELRAEDDVYLDIWAFHTKASV